MKLALTISATLVGILIWLMFKPSSCDYQGMRIVAVKYELEKLERSLELYQEDNGEYPAKLNALIPKYVRKLPIDPWGNPYQYKRQNKAAEIYSIGRDAS